MSSHSFEVLQEFGDQWSAVAVQSLLSGAGIESHLIGTDPAAALSMGGAPTDSLVRVRVSRSDLERAQELLREHEKEMQHRQPWQCERCDEPNDATFEYCWNCQAKRSSIPIESTKLQSTVEPTEADEAPYSSNLQSKERLKQSDNPYQPTVVEGTQGAPDQIEDTEENAVAYETAFRRAWLASACTLVLFPLLICFLSLYLLLTLPPRPASVPKPVIRLRFAWVVTLISMSANLVLIYRIFWS